MAREESDREDLLRDATALVERIELAPADAVEGEHVVVGFRADGCASFYFGSEPAYHFNTAGELRRAFQHGLLYKAERGQLAALERVRTADAVELRRLDLPAEEQSNFAANALRRLRELHDRIGRNELKVVGKVPADVDVLDRVQRWLHDRREVKIAESPRVGRN